MEETVGDRLEALRMAAGLPTRRLFAASFGMDQSQYSRVVSGIEDLSIKMGKAISRRYGVTLEFIFFGTRAGVSEDLENHLTSILTKRSGDQA